MARKNSTGPYRGFDRMELAMHSPIGGWHYSLWLQKNHPDEIGGFAPLLTALPGGDTGAPEVKYNPIPREHYHTDWVAARTIAYLDSLDPDDNWFVWMSFPDPASSVGPAAGRGAANQLARSRSARRLSRLARED